MTTTEVGKSEKQFVLCVKKEQLCTHIILFGTFFQAIFYGGRRERTTTIFFFLGLYLFLKIAAFFYEMLNKQGKIWEDTNSAYLVKFLTAIVLLIALTCHRLALRVDSRANQGDCKMGGAKLRISPRGEEI